jgi:hypothetical protein
MPVNFFGVGNMGSVPHFPQMIRYDGVYMIANKQQALEAWERKLNNIITGSESNVIPISAGKKAA